LTERIESVNVILLISDTFRYDNLFDWATEMPVNTPCLDKFSERAVSCSRMFMSSFPTIPHRTDVTTGRYGWPWYGWQDRLKSSRNHIPIMLGQKGYVSQLITDCPHLYNNNFHNGFTAGVAVRGQENDLFMLKMNHPIKEVMPREKTRFGEHLEGHPLVDLHCWMNRAWSLDEREDLRFPPRTAAKTVEFLEQNYKYESFFLWVDFFDPHEPWDPPEYLVKKYDPDYTGTPMLHPNYGHASDYTPEELKNLRAHYCADAELVDRWVGRVFQKLDDLALWDNTIVIFTADHGTCLGEHDRTGKSNINQNDDRPWPLYPEIAHQPFLIAAPGLEGGKTVDTLVTPADIIPTVIDLAGLDIEPPEPFHGKSFAPQLRGESTDEVNDCAITASVISFKSGAGNPLKMTVPVVYADRWAFAPIGSDEQPELYDLDADPLAANNVADANPAVVKEMREKALKWLRRVDAPEKLNSVFAE